MTAPRKYTRSRRRSLAIEHAALEHSYEELQKTFKELTDRFYGLSLSLARREYAPDRIDAAMQAMFRAPREVQAELILAPHPFGAVVDWHRRGGMH
jgi:hypothetical protein